MAIVAERDQIPQIARTLGLEPDRNDVMGMQLAALCQAALAAVVVLLVDSRSLLRRPACDRGSFARDPPAPEIAAVARPRPADRFAVGRRETASGRVPATLVPGLVPAHRFTALERETVNGEPFADRVVAAAGVGGHLSHRLSRSALGGEPLSVAMCHYAAGNELAGPRHLRFAAIAD